VAHIGDINPNLMDATFVVSACDWIMAEFIRLYHMCDSNEAQRIIDSLVERKVPIIEEFGDALKVLTPSLSIPNKILLILYKKHPNYVSTSDLKKWIQTKSPSYISTALDRLENDTKVHRKEKENIITRKGIEYVENVLLKEV
jgi:Mn-containing catalase